MKWGKGQLPNPPWRPPSPASLASWRLLTSTQHIFPSTWQDGQPKWSAFIYATSQDPLLTAKLQNSGLEHVFLSVFMLGLHTKEKGLPSPQEHMGNCCQFNLCNVETWSSLSPPCGKLHFLCASRLFWRLPSLFFILVYRTSHLSFNRVRRQPKPFSPSKII